MSSIKQGVAGLVAVGMLLAAGGAPAEPTPEELLAEIKARAEKTNQFRALLNDPDQATRLAALDVMSKSDDVTMRELAFGIGFSSADDAMRAVALKNKFSYVTTLPIKLSTPDKPTETEKKVLTSLASVYPFQIAKYDVNTGHFNFAGLSNSSFKGQINGTGMEFQDHYGCIGRFTLGDGPVLTGSISCSHRNYQGTYPATIRLN